ncbi:glycoside hydrolase family 31 protein [Gloeobacter kilaueensis]|uniref:Alpha-glucosidase n=1 Tax=Gloeobacter kilaueensis (strain ATCC BAA-2537 / CCAP 1431/1 / ULC 316 / JS1) TaxID=1183438 RepID=U5QID1_GLOK1|nr:TIM-barrel domain-containing protein [Gloeobacter kilaueensis]AGY58747.1 alpha-glucosidase [Gloeobacter kilaueensis JS1]
MPQYFGQLPTSDLPWSTPQAITSWTRHLRGVRFECGGPTLDLTVLAHDLVRVRFAPGGTFLPRRSWAVSRHDSEWPAVDFGFAERSEGFELTTEQLRIVVERATCRLGCFDPAGRAFACDSAAGLGWRTGQIAAWKRIEADEHFYGFGERTGLLDKRSERLTNWATDALDYGSLTDNMYQAIPFFIALRPGLAYGVFLNSTFFSHFDLGAEKSGCWQMQTCAPELDYYLIYGPTPERILFRYTELTGRAPLPPIWALGYHQCRWSYDSEDEVYELARTFRSRRIPCDVIHLDIDYMRGYRVFTWSPSRFSDPKKLISDLGSQGFRTVAIVDPGVKYEPEANYAVFDQGLAKNYFVRTASGQLFHGYVWPDKAVFPDFLNSAVRRWWGDWHARLTEMGVAGIWNDMNEPTIDDRPFGDGGTKISFPSDAAAGDPAEQATWAEGHNLYGQQMVRACREGLDRLRPTERSFVLTRSGFAGIQRYGAVWMGDNQSQWEHLELSLPMLCNMGLSGVAFVGADIGGFARNATAELFARWMQVGTLYPLMRGHSALHTARHEPWVFGERVEAICRKYIELRYQLLPYLYTLFWRAMTHGEPILRPLVYQYPDDERTYQLHDQVLLGPLLMAAPILRPGSDCRAVYLPAGLWHDWWTGERFEGPAHILAHAPLDRLPLYVPAGAALPMNPVRQHTGEPTDALIWRVWPGEGSWTLYEDDGNSFAYREGQWATTTCRVQQTAVELTERQGNWQPPERQIRIELLGCGSRQFCDDGAARQLLFRESCN